MCSLIIFLRVVVLGLQKNNKKIKNTSLFSLRFLIRIVIFYFIICFLHYCFLFFAIFYFTLTISSNLAISLRSKVK